MICLNLKIKAFSLSCALFLCFCITDVRAADISAESGILYDPLTERILWSRNEHEKMPMASTTKIMTALVAMSLYEPESVVEIQPEWTGIEGSSMYLKPGEQLSVYDLLCGTLLMSGNDAATALAGILTGNTEDFVELMNRKARRLCMEDTSYENPSGLDGEHHYSTAYDMAVLASEAMKYDDFREIVSSRSISTAGRTMSNHNKLLGMYDGACGIKTGYTKKAGRCLVSAAERQGRMLVAVTLSAPDDWNDHMALYDQAFESMTQTPVLESGDMGEVYVATGGNSSCGIYVQQSYSALLFPGDEQKVSVSIEGPRIVYPPVYSGEKYGEAVVRLNGQEIFRTDVYFESDVALPQREKGFFEKIKDRLFGMRN